MLAACVRQGPALYHETVVGLQEQRNAGLILADVALVDEVDRERLASKLRAHLTRGVPDSGAWPYDDLILLEPPLREVDFWAFVFAEAVGASFELHVDQTDAERDAQIYMLLRDSDVTRRQTRRNGHTSELLLPDRGDE